MCCMCFLYANYFLMLSNVCAHICIHISNVKPVHEDVMTNYSAKKLTSNKKCNNKHLEVVAKRKQ